MLSPAFTAQVSVPETGCRRVPGVIAGGAVRAVLELAGVSDVLSKCIGSRTPINMVHATVAGLKELKTIESVSKLREKKPQEIR